MINIANAITLTRLLMFIVFLYCTQYLTQQNIIVFIFVLGLIFIMDCFDGFAARKHNVETTFGAFFDIYSDRIIESLLWILFYLNGLIGVDVMVVVVARILTVDLIRVKLYFYDGDVPFKQLKNTYSEFIVSNKIMKFIYGSLKLWVFSLLLYKMSQDIAQVSEMFDFIINISVYITLFMMILRGIPVIIEYILFKNK